MIVHICMPLIPSNSACHSKFYFLLELTNLWKSKYNYEKHTLIKIAKLLLRIIFMYQHFAILIVGLIDFWQHLISYPFCLSWAIKLLLIIMRPCYYNSGGSDV